MCELIVNYIANIYTYPLLLMWHHRYKPEDISYGVIPYCVSDDQVLYLLIQHRAWHRAFPKGHPEDGETQLQAALRELQEETWIKSDQLTINEDDMRYTEKYKFRYRGAPIRKTVHYVLGQCQTQLEINLQLAEVKDSKWCTYDEAVELITFEEGKTLLSKLNNYVITL